MKTAVSPALSNTYRVKYGSAARKRCVVVPVNRYDSTSIRKSRSAHATFTSASVE